MGEHGLTAARIGAWLLAARTEQGTYSRERVAPLVGVTARTIYDWENGGHAPPADKFFALASLYGADVRELLRPEVPTLPLMSEAEVRAENQRAKSRGAGPAHPGVAASDASPAPRRRKQARS